MNALAKATQRTSLVAKGRFASSTTTAFPKQPVPEIYQNYSVQKAWFSDPSTYPLIATMSCAAFFVIGASINAFTHYKDVRINPAHKHQTIRNWGAEPTVTLTKALSRAPTPEGLGVNHAEWKRQKELYRSH